MPWSLANCVIFADKLSSKLKSKLLEISESKKGLKALINEYRNNLNFVNFQNEMIFLDINTSQEYLFAKKKFS